MRKTKIVCTIGPASESPEILEQLIDAGMNVARLNFSHGNHEEHKTRIETIRNVAREKRESSGHSIRYERSRNTDTFHENGQAGTRSRTKD